MLAVLAFVAAASMGADSDARDIAMSPIGAVDAPSVTIDPMPYTRTVTCSDYTVTGTWAVDAPTGWTASPSGDSGVCSDTGGGTFSCVVDVNPDAVGEGVETITVTNGTATDEVTIGFYVDGEHTCLLAQNVDGTYNSTFNNNDAIATWQNIGSSGLDLAQATGSAQPTFKVGIVNGQPMAYFDGGDRVVDTVASNWTFLSNGTDWTAEIIFSTLSAAPASSSTVFSTTNSTTGRGTNIGWSDVGINDFIANRIRDGAGTNVVSLTSAADAFPAQTFGLITMVLDDDGGAGIDGTLYSSGTSVATAARTGSYSASAPVGPLHVGSNTDASNSTTGYIFRVFIYQSALTATQRGINEAVDEWALGGALPVVASAAAPNPNLWAFVGDSLTSGSGGVTTWVSKLSAVKPSGVSFVNYAVGGATAPQIYTQFANNCKATSVPGKLFVLGGINSIKAGVNAATTFSSLDAIYNEADALGTEVVAITTLPFGTWTGWTAPNQTQLELLHTSILADPSPTTYVDLYAVMGEPGSPEDLAAAYDNGDGIHPNEAGTTLMADTVATALGL